MQTQQTDTVDLLTTTDAGALVQAAFKHINAREFPAAQALVDRALTIAPRNPMVAHTKTHLDTDSGAFSEGAAYLRTFLSQTDPTQGINVHSSWHLAALELELCRPAAALALHERIVLPKVAEYPMTFFSAVTLLWRLELYGFGAATRARGESLPWDTIHAVALTIAEPSTLDQVARSITFITTGDAPSLTAALDHLHSNTPEVTPEIAAQREIAIPLIQGLQAFWQGDYEAVCRLMEPVSPSIPQLSRFAEHQIPLEDTLLEAQLRTGRFAAAEQLLQARSTKGLTPRDLYRLGRALHGLGRTAEATASLRTAKDRWSEAEPDAPEFQSLQSLQSL